MKIEEIREQLLIHQEIAYRDFQRKLMPTVEEERVIGVRTPVLRKMAKELFKDPEIDEFLQALPHEYYEENNLHTFILCEEKNYEKAIAQVNAILPYIDNWATCDQMRPKAFAKNKDKLIGAIDGWLLSEHTYTKRFGVEMLMSFYLDDDFFPEVLEKVANVKSEEYYVRMMVAWFFATALAKRWEETIGYLQKRRLDDWTHNKTIQKAIESYRVTDEQKKYLRSLKIGK